MKNLFILVLGALFALSFTVSAETVIYEFKPVQGDFSKAFYQRKAALGECDNFPCLVLAGNAQWRNAAKRTWGKPRTDDSGYRAF